MIHPTAIIEEGAHIAEDVSIGSYAHIAKGAVIGEGVTIDPHVTVRSAVTVGAGTRLYPFVVLGNGSTAVEIAADCHIREFTRILTETKEQASVSIGEGCYIMAYTHIAQGVVLERGCTITNNVILSAHSRCQPRVIIGAKSTVDAGCTIGTGSMIGAVSAVRGDIPPYTLAEGHPQALIRGLNLVGMRRQFESRESITAVKHLFHQLKQAGYDRTLAAKLAQETSDPHARYYAAFVAAHTISA